MAIYMIMNRILAYLFIIMLTVFPVSAGSVSLNRWVMNVTVNDDGTVEEIIQAEFENTGPSSLNGFSFVVPASNLVIDPQSIMSIPSTDNKVQQQAIPGGIKVSINFATPLEAGKKWSGRFTFTAEKWAVKEGMDYSIKIPISAPKAITGGNEVDFSVPTDPEIRSQVFFPKSVNVTSVEVKSGSSRPFKKLMQFNHMVITWFQLGLGDEVIIKGSYSDILRQIIETDERSRELKDKIKKAKESGRDVTEAEAHIKNADEYNNNQALQSFWVNDFDVVKEYVGYAGQELSLAEKSLSSAGEIKATPKGTESSKQTPGFGAATLILIIMSYFAYFRKKMS